MNLAATAQHVRRLFPVVVGGKLTVLIVAELFLLVAMLLMALGEAPSRALFSGLIFPSMLLIALCSTDVVASLRAGGELELAVTLASPTRVVLHRLAPILSVAVAQYLGVSVLLVFYLAWWQLLVGFLFGIAPLALIATAALYWNLRLRSAGGVLGAGLATLVLASWWIGSHEMFSESENMMMTTGQIVWSAIRCQIGLAVTTVIFAALARRRLQNTEELLDA